MHGGIVGMKGWMGKDIGVLINKLGLTRSVTVLGFVTDQQLRHFYNKTEVFVFPSLYEGFGFPIVEAFSCGAAVVTSNVSSCPEIAGDAALTVNPKDPGEIADAIHSVISDSQLKEQLKRRGLKRAEDFDFKKTAEETLKVYNEVCNT